MLGIEDKLVGRTIVRVEKGETYVTIHLDDGSEFSFTARGTEEVWIETD